MEDLDSTLEIIAMLFKLIGNSGYGGTLIDRLKFMKVQYVEVLMKLAIKLTINSFKTLTKLQDEIYETELNHSCITINTPIQIGNMTLQYSK